MSDGTRRPIRKLPTPSGPKSRVPSVATGIVWSFFVASLGALLVQSVTSRSWGWFGIIAIDGLTVVMWTAVTFFSGIVHSYSKRYMAGDKAIDRFFKRIFVFTLIVIILVAADSFLLFGSAWLAMGLVMAGLIGHSTDWPQAQAAAALARRYFITSSGLLMSAFGLLWWHGKATAISEIPAAVAMISQPVGLAIAGIVMLAAMVQSALIPFHTWLLSSMTAPTPASALMHAGFVNAGGVLLVRVAPVVTIEPWVLLVIAFIGGVSAILGKFLKTVQADIKGQLGCSTVGQMGFMILQAGIGFFAAAITHLILHGFYKAYQFLSAGGRVSRTTPQSTHDHGTIGLVGGGVMIGTAIAGGGMFMTLTGKQLAPTSGVLLTTLVVVMVLHATRLFVRETALPSSVRYGAVPLFALSAIAIYATVFVAIRNRLAGLPGVGQSAELTVVHGLLVGGFLLAYIAIETGAYRYSRRLYVAFLNMTRPPADTTGHSSEAHNEY